MNFNFYIKREKNSKKKKEVRMKKLCILFLFFLLVSSVTAQNWFKGTFDDALVESRNGGKMVLIDFFSSG